MHAATTVPVVAVYVYNCNCMIYCCMICLSELNDALCRNKCYSCLAYIVQEMLNQVFGYNTGVCGNVVIVTHNTTINLTCTTSGRRTPDWFVNETAVTDTGRDGYRVTTSNGVYKTATLMINGNRTCEALNVYCEIYNTTERQFVHMHNTTLRFQGWLHTFLLLFGMGFLHQCIVNQLPLTFTDRLPSPENVHTINSSIIEWKPPFSARNNKSDVISVDPHSTQYTVYIIDNYTGNIIFKENVRETQYTLNNSDNGACHITLIQ